MDNEESIRLIDAHIKFLNGFGTGLCDSKTMEALAAGRRALYLESFLIESYRIREDKKKRSEKCT